jgi:ABC-type branched-subunit amino acid transport system ATPase component
MSADAILALTGVSKHFGGLNVVDDLSFAVRRGSRTALIGPNGAGKTTVFNLISGVFPVDAGAIRMDGTDITAIASRRRIRHGIARTFQNVRLMPHLSTLENVIVGQHSRSGGWRGFLHPVNLVPRNRWREEARAALADAGLGDYAKAAVGSLPYGVQKRIEVVRALMAKPALLLLDEPAAGLNPAETETLQLYLEKLAVNGGLTLLVVEHDMHFVGALCGDVVVLSFGKKIAEGSPDAIRQDPHVQEVYLGRPAAAIAPAVPQPTEYRRAAGGA